MLGKLIKYEFKHTAKTMALTFAVLAVATLMGSIALYRISLGTDNTFLSVVSVIMVIFYLLAIVAIYCVDFIYLCANYHKTMYSAQGYLTHTLPVSPAATFGVKILVMFAWMFVATLLSAISFVTFLQVSSAGRFFDLFDKAAWYSFSQEVNAMFGISCAHLLILFVVEGILGILLYILWVTASMAIGQLSQKSRTGFSILAAAVFYVIYQILSTVFLALSGYSLFSLIDGTAATFMKNVLYGSIALTAAALVILYGICVYINKRKLNLE